MGFCFFNNVAVAAAHARARGLARVAIVDYDVHHGNGTQWSFYDDPSVLFISSHQYPVLPGHRRGRARSAAAAGAGFTVNLPLAAGATDADFERVYTTIALPDPAAVPAGADPDLGRLRRHVDDPLGGMRADAPASSAGSRRASSAVADECCDGRVVARHRRRLRPARRCADCLRASIARARRGDAARSRLSRAGEARRRAATRRSRPCCPISPNHWKL